MQTDSTPRLTGTLSLFRPSPRLNRLQFTLDELRHAEHEAETIKRFPTRRR